MDIEDQQQNNQQQNKLQKKGGFAQYAFFPELYLNIMINKLKAPTQVQKKVVPLIMQGKDVVACYKTGSGKTLAYLLPMINMLKSHSQIVGARALIMIPTRDLADQITQVLKRFLHKMDLRYSLILGGHDYTGQFESLSINPDIIIATPGRLVQLLTETDLKLSRVQMIVFDEADQLFGENKFQKEIKEIVSKCPSSQRIMCSATITEDLTSFASVGMREYSYVHQQISLPETMKLDFFIIRPQQKTSALLYVLEKIVKKQKVIIFASTRFHVDYLLSIVSELYECYGVYGKMDMEQRTYNLDAFRKKKSNVVLIVTDVAARGLDIPSVNFVIQYDYPSNHQIFVHRSGRTARAEQQGHTISFVTFQEISYMAELSTYVAKKLTNDANATDSINYGTLPNDILIAYTNYANQLKEKNPEILQHQEISLKAFEKFKKCRAQASQYSLKKAKALKMELHNMFKDSIEKDEAEFLQKIKNFNPKKSFLELQRITQQKVPENDHFLAAIDKIRKQQAIKLAEQTKRDRLKANNSSKWKQILNKNQVREFQKYRESLSQVRLPISGVDGIQIELNEKLKKSFKKDFKNPSQYITMAKDPNVKTEFDSLPKIRTNEMQDIVEDQNMKKKKKQRVWDKTKKNYVWQKDQQDKMSKQEKGKKAYQQWKKKSKLSIPQAGEVEDQRKTSMARQNWVQRRKFRHGWKEAKQSGSQGGRLNLKNNKAKAFEKKFKTKLIQKASKGRGGSKGGSKGFKGGSKGLKGGSKGAQGGKGKRR